MPCLLSSLEVTPETNPSACRISAIRSLRFERGHSTSCLRARIPFLIRARKSAIGSVIDIGSPARLDDARDVAAERELAEAATTHLELTEVGARTATALAAALDPDLELLLLGKRIDQLGHDLRGSSRGSSSGSRGRRHGLTERHAEVTEQRAALCVGRSGRHDADVHALDRVDLVVLDLREDDLLLHAHGEVAAAVEPT